MIVGFFMKNDLPTYLSTYPLTYLLHTQPPPKNAAAMAPRSGHHGSNGRRPQHIGPRSAGGNSAWRLQTVRPLIRATPDVLDVVLLSDIGTMMS